MTDVARVTTIIRYSENADFSYPILERSAAFDLSSPTRYMLVQLTVPTTGVTLDLGTFTTVDKLLIRNLDADNYVVYRARHLRGSKTFATTKISFVDSNPDTITDADSTFLTAFGPDGILGADFITVSGATDSGNNTSFTLQTATAGTLTLTTAATLTARANDAGTPTIVATARMTGKVNPDNDLVVLSSVYPTNDLVLTADTASCEVEVIAVGT